MPAVRRCGQRHDSAAYAKLFAPDAIRIPPGSEPEHGPEAIRKGEQADYDAATWKIVSTPLDALQIAEDWVYGIAHVDATTTAHDSGDTRQFEATKTWLLHRRADGEWLIARQMWNLK